MVMVNAAGIRVEQILLQTGSRPRTVLRIRHGRYLVAYCATVYEVAQLVDLASLVPEQA